MKNKKGFTLVELLSVVAILAILVIIAIPNVLILFNNAKKNSFETELKSIYEAAETKWISESLYDASIKTYSKCSENCGNELDLNGGGDVEYYIELNSSGKVTEFHAKNKSFQYSYSGPGLDKKDINDVISLGDLDDTQKINISCADVTKNSVSILHNNGGAGGGAVADNSIYHYGYYDNNGFVESSSTTLDPSKKLYLKETTSNGQKRYEICGTLSSKTVCLNEDPNLDYYSLFSSVGGYCTGSGREYNYYGCFSLYDTFDSCHFEEEIDPSYGCGYISCEIEHTGINCWTTSDSTINLMYVSGKRLNPDYGCGDSYGCSNKYNQVGSKYYKFEGGTTTYVPDYFLD